MDVLIRLRQQSTASLKKFILDGNYFMLGWVEINLGINVVSGERGVFYIYYLKCNEVQVAGCWRVFLSCVRVALMFYYNHMRNAVC